MSERDAIPYLTRWPRTLPTWLDALRAAMPDERVVSFDELTAAERQAVRVAVVSDPDTSEIEALPGLEWVQSTWMGVEKIVSEAPARLGIARMVDPRMTTTMSEAVLTAVLWLHRDGPRYARQQRDALWRHSHFVRPERRRVLVLGLGELGGAAALRLARNGFDVHGWSRTPKAIDGVTTHDGPLATLTALSDVDIVVNLLPHTPATQAIVDVQVLSAIRPGAGFINFGRGATVDEAALLAALEAGQVGEAFLDVFANEPLPADHPFWTHERVTVWPHVSAPTDPESASLVVAKAVRQWRMTGTPPALVDRERGY